MAHLVPIPFLAVTVTLLVRARFRSDQRQIFFFKPVSTLLVIAVALLSFLTPGAHLSFTLWIALGLVLSLGGDVALMLESNKAFLIGLVLFLLAHVVYSIAFTLPNGFHPQDLVSGAVLLVLGVGIYLYLRPGLGSMKGPVIFYMLVICFMVSRAVSTFFGDTFSLTQAWLMTLGATLFWLSDLVLAINRFRCPLRLEALSLFLYYGGQLLIALSPSYFL
jgi:alkenylglycerophosphocholine/alkenylglycerophosphoethanolamine hydrolase